MVKMFLVFGFPESKSAEGKKIKFDNPAKNLNMIGRQICLSYWIAPGKQSLSLDQIEKHASNFISLAIVIDIAQTWPEFFAGNGMFKETDKKSGIIMRVELSLFVCLANWSKLWC